MSGEAGLVRRLGSFRVRVFLLITLVAVSAVGLTALLTAQQATAQINTTVSVEQSVTDRLGKALRDYGLRHGTWEGVADDVDALATETGQRIRLATGYGEVVVDTDQLRGGESRPVPTAPATVVSPRPELDLGRVVEKGTRVRDVDAAIALTAKEIWQYRRGVLLAACLTRNGRQVQVVGGPYGVPRYESVTGRDPALGDVVAGCHRRADEGSPHPGDLQMASACKRSEVLRPFTDGGSAVPSPGRTTAVEPDVRPSEPMLACLEDVFSRRADSIAPVNLLLYLGVRPDEPGVRLEILPVLAIAALVAIAAIGSTVLLSRRVLRPIDSLIHASSRLGSGDLTERVPVTGRDELADLATAFNRMAASLEESEARQRRMVADIAHELRTPLANVRGYLEALSDGVMEPTPELFASLHEEAVLQQRIVSDLQDLALAESGRMVAHRGPVDLAELAETCRLAHLAVAEANQVELRTESTGPVRIEADPDRLRQAVGNLVSNALRATPEDGRVVLRVREDGGRAVLEVADTGHGISPGDLPHVFDRFWRADAARGRATGGSGLGLAIAREIIAAHDGTITARSTMDAGSVFTVTLPLSGVDGQ
jgi:two-component system sensor histidine kinase BaeS